MNVKILQLVQASHDEIETVCNLLFEMQQEIDEFSLTFPDLKRGVDSSWSKNMFWFLFKDEKKEKFVGCCYLTPIHVYYTPYPYYYIGGVFLQPDYRGKGLFKESMLSLEQWISCNGGGYMTAHISKKNKRSGDAFRKAGFIHDSYQVQWTDFIKPKE